MNTVRSTLHRRHSSIVATHRRVRQYGVSLVELMVGMAIGLITVLVITQVFLMSEEQRRIPTSGANAQINGVLALDALQRDIRQSGYGLFGGAWLGCTTGASTEADAVALGDATLAPVRIVPASGTGMSDSIVTLSSGKIDAALQFRTVEDHTATDTAFVVPSALTIENGDWMLVADNTGSPCHVFQVNAAPSLVVNSLGVSSDWRIPHADPAGNGLGAITFTAPSVLTNLGQPIHRQWSVDSSFRLQMTDLAAGGSAEDAYPEIVLLRAFYGKDTNGDGSIDTYDTDAPAATAWGQVLGVRLAIVTRSPHYNREEVTNNSLAWNLGNATVTGAAACADDSSSQCVSLTLSHVGTDWTHYRYRLFDTMIPLRNLLWTAQ